LDDDKASEELFALIGDEPDNIVGDDASDGSGVAEEEDTVGTVATSEDEFSEVLVFRQQDAFFAQGEAEDVWVASAGGEFGDGENLMAGGPEGADDGEVATLIGEEAHGGRLRGSNEALSRRT
jgi:hypothetical protein